MSKEIHAGLAKLLSGEACIICLASPLPDNHDPETCELV